MVRRKGAAKAGGRPLRSGVTHMDAAESYIAVHPLELEDRLNALDPSHTTPLVRWHAIKDSIHEEIHRLVRAKYGTLLAQYGRLDPDGERSHAYLNSATDEAKDALGLEVIDRIDDLLLAANYRRLSPSDISHALKTASSWGLKLRVRFKDFHRLRVYARGEGVELRSRREWFLFFSKRTLSVPVYRQMVVLFQSRISESTGTLQGHMSMRMFKNIPHADLDMLLPGTVRMSLLDQGRIGIPTLWGFAMLASKLARSLWLLALLGAVKILTSLTFIAAVLIAGSVYGFKYFFSYRQAHNRHLLSVTRSLYYQTLSNNGGVLLRLLDEAEQQMACQILLLIYVFERAAPEECQSVERLDQTCEDILSRLGMGAINFDIQQTLPFLVRNRIVVCDEHGWHLTP